MKAATKMHNSIKVWPVVLCAVLVVQGLVALPASAAPSAAGTTDMSVIWTADRETPRIATKEGKTVLVNKDGKTLSPTKATASSAKTKAAEPKVKVTPAKSTTREQLQKYEQAKAKGLVKSTPVKPVSTVSTSATKTAVTTSEPEVTPTDPEPDPELNSSDVPQDQRLPYGGEVYTQADCYWYRDQYPWIQSHLYECGGGWIVLTTHDEFTHAVLSTVWLSVQYVGRAWTADTWDSSIPASQAPTFMEYDWTFYVAGTDGDLASYARSWASFTFGSTCRGFDTAASTCATDGSQSWDAAQLLGSSQSSPFKMTTKVTINQSSSEGTGPDKISWWSVTNDIQAWGMPPNPMLDSQLSPDSIRCDQNQNMFLYRKGCVFAPNDDSLVSSFNRLNVGNPEVAEMSQHVLDAQDSNYDYNLYITPLRDPDKVIPGTWETAPLTRDNSTATQARRTMRAVCQARSDYVNSDIQQCDEYPFASTAENAANPNFDYSTRPIAKADNETGGGYLGGWYYSQRILQGDRFYVNVQFPLVCGVNIFC